MRATLALAGESTGRRRRVEASGCWLQMQTATEVGEAPGREAEAGEWETQRERDKDGSSDGQNGMSRLQRCGPPRERCCRLRKGDAEGYSADSH